MAFHSRKLLALLCLVVLLSAMLAPGLIGLAWALPAPLWLAVALLIGLSLRRGAEDPALRPFPFFGVLPSRSPPRS
jgi:hypothetical protein